VEKVKPIYKTDLLSTWETFLFFAHKKGKNYSVPFSNNILVKKRKFDSQWLKKDSTISKKLFFDWLRGHWESNWINVNTNYE